MVENYRNPMAASDQLRIIVPDGDIRFNAVLDHWSSVGDFHAKGYRRASEILLQRFLDNPDGTAGDRDSLVLPILFLFRHYLELRFKDILVYGQLLSGQHAQWRLGHPLKDLWADTQKVVKDTYGADVPQEFLKAAACVTDLIQLDPDSQSFRYPRDRNGRPMFENVVIGLKALRTTIGSIADCLDGISMDMSVRAQNQA
jgi:hypothetical protein